MVDVSSYFFFQAEDGIRDADVTGVQTCALPICVSAGGLSEAISLLTKIGFVTCHRRKGERRHYYEMKEDSFMTAIHIRVRSEERRVGKECRSRLSLDQ